MKPNNLKSRSYKPVILEEIKGKYIREYEEVLGRRALQYERLAEKDIFEMDQDQAKKHTDLLQKLGKELIIMDKMRWLAESYRECTLEYFDEFLHLIITVRIEYEQICKEAVFWKFYCQDLIDQEKHWIDFSLELAQQIKDLKNVINA